VVLTRMTSQVTLHGEIIPSLGKFKVVYAHGVHEETLGWDEVMASALMGANSHARLTKGPLERKSTASTSTTCGDTSMLDTGAKNSTTEAKEAGGRESIEDSGMASMDQIGTLHAMAFTAKPLAVRSLLPGVSAISKMFDSLEMAMHMDTHCGCVYGHEHSVMFTSR
jgi:hypothetical protein